MQNEYPFYLRATIKLFLVVLIVYIMIMGRELLIPLTISFFFTFLLLPVSGKLKQWKFPDWLAIILSILLAIAVFGGLIYFFYAQIISFGDDLPELKKKLAEKINTIQIYIRETFHISKREQAQWLDKQMEETVNSGDQYVMDLFSATGSFIANIALIPIYIFFLTYYKEKLKTFIVLVIKDKNPENALTIIRKISTVSQKYLKGLMLDIFILSILNSTGFLLLGLDHAILFGVLASVLNIIPYIGVLIGSILPIIMALLTKDEIGYAIGVAAVTQVVQFLDNNFITPYVVGSSVSINPLTAVIVLISSALIWGIPGMILCMPLTGMVKVVCDNVTSLKPYGFLIGEEVNYRDKEHFHKRFLKQFSSKQKN